MDGIHDMGGMHGFMVLPKRPVGTEGLNEAELAVLVTRYAMIGVSLVVAVQE